MTLLWVGCAATAQAQPSPSPQPSPSSPSSQVEPQPVRSLHHGSVLFQHFQQRPWAALGALMVSQHFDRLAPHDADAELLRGGLLLDWGQHDEAAEVFERLAAQHPQHRDRAWTVLARARWQRGLVDAAEAAIARVEQPLPGERDDDRLLLQAQLHVARGRPGQAAQVLQPLTAPVTRGVTPHSAAALARHNHAVALLQDGQDAAARSALDAIGGAAATNEEQRVLRDRANLTLALEALRRQPPDAAAARQALQRVRLHSAAAARALLADGWAALQLGRPRDALVPWLELAERPATEAAVFEARLAVPQAYASLGARGEALTRTLALVQAFDTQAQELALARQALLDGQVLPPLLQRALQGHEPGREPSLDLPAAGEPGAALAATLAPVWADHGVQQALTRWADLQWVLSDLQRWQQALPAFDDLLALRRDAFAQRLPPTLLAADREADGLQAQTRALASLAAEVAQAEGQDDGLALADPQAWAQHRRLQGVLQDLDRLPPGDERDALAERVRRIRGALTWQLAQARPARLQAARKSLRALAEGAQQATQRLQALQQAQQQEPQRLAALAARTATLSRAVDAMQPRVRLVAEAQQQALQDLAVAVVAQQQQQLAGYQLQARLLLAQLQDGAGAEPPRTEARADVGGRDAQR
jgi:hypothetical protein